MGFTLVEIAIVLVIIGLLLGGVLKGQELINSAKVKNFANDFRNIPLFIYGYQDRYKALPGDDAQVATHVSGATLATTPAGTQGNGVINGVWDTTTATDETALFWQHVRLANFAAGPTSTADAAYYPTNADGGRIGIESGTGGGAEFITGLTGTYVICSRGILGKFAKQLDTTVDDGNTAAGSMRLVASTVVGTTRNTAPVTTALTDDATSYTVCMAF
ncbi:MAG: prepilin-type N-terminal cleavage/methylation domain-containing protein [Rhodocyclaceae bacterium]